MVTEMPKYDNVKTRQCQERRKRLGTEQISKDIAKIVFLEDILRVANNSSFLRIDRTDDDSEKHYFRLRLGRLEYLLRIRTYYFLSGTFKIVRDNSLSFIAHT